jgi:hypothetical protein
MIQPMTNSCVLKALHQMCAKTQCRPELGDQFAGLLERLKHEGGSMTKWIVAAVLLASLSRVGYAQRPYPTQAEENAAASPMFTAALPESAPAQIRDTLNKAHAAIDTAEALDFTPFSKSVQDTAAARIKTSKDVFNEVYDYAHKMLDTKQFSTASVYILQRDVTAISINTGQVDDLYRAQLLGRPGDASAEELRLWTAAFDASNALQDAADGWTSLIIASMKGDNSTFVRLTEKVQACTSAFTTRVTQ